jgi:hypothetical protein
MEPRPHPAGGVLSSGEGGGRIGRPALALPCRDTSGPKPSSQLLPYQQLRRVAEVVPAMGCSGFRKKLGQRDLLLLRLALQGLLIAYILTPLI